MSSFAAILIPLLVTLANASAATRYVWQDSPSPAPPYDSWTTAAHVIQDAVDVAQTGDSVLVAGGVYATGGRPVGTNQLVNRVAIDRAITVESLMGPEVTVIQGYQVPGTTNGDGAIRCVYLANGSSLSGFTLTNGATRMDWNYESDTKGGGVWCESTNAVVSNSVLTGNSAYYAGGGAYGGTLNNCTLNGNSALHYGGGTYFSTLNHCTLTGNSASSGGGAGYGTLNNCTLNGNRASYQGGGAGAGTLNNCTLTGNSADGWGGGAAGGQLNNCSLTGNSAGSYGGGVSAFEWWDLHPASLANCLVYFNIAPTGANYDSQTLLNYCCTTPLPEGGTGNISLDPLLATPSHLSADSPCRGAGDATAATGTDIDGEAWANPPSIGCDEYHPGAVTGPLSVEIAVSYTNVATGFPVEFTALIDGRTSASRWEFGDGMVLSNRPYASHAWAAPGDYAVVLRAYNESFPGGVSASVIVHVAVPQVHYVHAGGTNPVPPYTSWATAATTIQDAVDAATVSGSMVLVTNGVYAIGGRAMHGTMTNRVSVDKPLTVRSVNGPEFSIIQGYQVPSTTNGDGAIRCVFLADGASLSGFTLTNGATRMVDDWPRSRDGGGGGVWCETTAGVVSDCWIVGNSARYGGGASGSTLDNCTLTGNSAEHEGGGAFRSMLSNCVLTSNSASFRGGGVAYASLNNCTLTSNSAEWGGGAAGDYYAPCILNNCTLTGNSAYRGGGAYSSTLNNSMLTGNSATWGGGADEAALNNCTLTGNSASSEGGGAAHASLYNCVLYSNTAPTGPNYPEAYWSPINYSCTTPMPTNGVGNITNSPLFVDYTGGNLRLQPNSPCINAGNNAYVTSPNDLDGNPRIVGGTVDMGAHEFQPSAGVRYVNASNPNPASPYTTWATAARVIQDAVDAASAGEEIVVTNGLYVTGGRTVDTNMLMNRVAVDKPLTLRSVNGPEFTIIQGYQVAGTTNGDGAIRCVCLADGASLSGFTLTNGATWAVVGNWPYGESEGGGVWCASEKPVISDCVLVGNSAAFEGGGAFRGTLTKCRLTANSAAYGGGAAGVTLNNCTLIGNSAEWGGGGAEASTLNNCILSGNSAGWSGGGAYYGELNHCTLTGNSAGSGGGSAESWLHNCTLAGNSASQEGGGAFDSTLDNCMLIGNSASLGGGAAGGCLYNCTLTGNSADLSGGGVSGFESWWPIPATLANCVAYFNVAPTGANYTEDTVLDYCCTSPTPTNGVGNITNAPLFVNYAAGNLRLQSNSPCINAGDNAYVTSSTDLDGNPRIVSGTVDIGAYEYQGPGSVISYAWLQQYGLPTDGSADAVDSDADGHATWQEWHCQTNPTNALSALRLLSATPSGANVTVTWQSVAGVIYFLERSTNLAGPPPIFTPLAAGITGEPGSTSFADTNASSLSPFFYRVGVPE